MSSQIGDTASPVKSSKMTSFVFDLEFHPYANVFPLMEGPEFDDFVKDVRLKNELQNPITIFDQKGHKHDGKILDGRNRYRACEITGVYPKQRLWRGTDEETAEFVVRENLLRRNLNESQRAMCAERLANMTRGDNQHAPIGATSQEDAAEKLNVSRRAVQRAHKVRQDGTPELTEKVEKGEVSVSTAADIATLPEDEQKEVVAKGEKVILEKAKKVRGRKAESRRKKRVQKLQDVSEETRDLTGEIGQFPIIYADPPWQYEHVETDSRATKNRYPTMTFDEICALKVSEVCTEDAVLFLWATSPKLAEAMRVIRAWGFDYRTNLVWVKKKMSMGYYFRQQHELLLVAEKGDPPAPYPKDRPSSYFIGRRLNRSAKPPGVAALIERMYPDLPKIELFARTVRRGWHSWGNEEQSA